MAGETLGFQVHHVFSEAVMKDLADDFSGQA